MEALIKKAPANEGERLNNGYIYNAKVNEFCSIEQVFEREYFGTASEAEALELSFHYLILER